MRGSRARDGRPAHPEDHRRARHEQRGRVQPDLPAPRRRVRAGRAGAGPRAACSTSAAASATAYAALAPRETVGRRHRRGLARRAGARDGGRRHARAAVPAPPASRRSSRCTRSSTFRIPSGSSRGSRVLEAGGVAVFATPNRLTFGRPDEIIDPFHHVEFDPDELRRLCAGGFAACGLRGVFGSERYMELFREERAKLDRLLRRDPLRLRRLVPQPRSAGSSTTCCCGVTAATRTRVLRRSRRDDFVLPTTTSTPALDLCRDLPRPAERADPWSSSSCPLARRQRRSRDRCGDPPGPGRRGDPRRRLIDR